MGLSFRNTPTPFSGSSPCQVDLFEQVASRAGYIERGEKVNDLAEDKKRHQREKISFHVQREYGRVVSVVPVHAHTS